MKKGVIILVGMLILLGVVAFSSGARFYGHGANEIMPGIFGQVYAGNWSFMNGNVGIGMSNPTTRLYVLDTSDTAHGVIINTTSSNANAALHVVRNGSTLLWVGKNGRIGVNKAFPSYALEVYGSMYASSGISSPTISANILSAQSWYNYSTATNGYAKMANIMIQWGSYISTKDGMQYFTFNKSFDHDCLSFTLDISTGNDNPGCNKTTFWFDRTNSIDGNRLFHVIAIGY